MLQNILIILLRFLLVVADKYFIDRNILDKLYKNFYKNITSLEKKLLLKSNCRVLGSIYFQ